MSLSIKRVLGVILLLGMSACSYDIGHFSEIDDEAVLAEELARWKNAEVIKLDLQNNVFSSRILQVEIGKPYVLEITNKGKDAQSFKAGDFFDTIKYDMLDEGVMRYKMRYITSLALLPHETKKYYFIPTTLGHYEFSSGNYAVAIPPVHLSMSEGSAAFGAIVVHPNGYFCSFVANPDTCEKNVVK